MDTRRRRVQAASALAALALCLALPALARAQEGDDDPPSRPAAQRRDEVNHEVQLFLLVASGEGGARGQLPESLGGVVRQLRATLPHVNYRVALTLVQRVRDGSSIEFGGVGAPLLLPTGGAAPPASSVIRYVLGRVRLVEEAAGGRFIHIQPLRFNVRLPDTSTNPAGQQDTSLGTDISVREGEPTVVGTITTGRPDELFVLVVSAKRAGR